MKSASIKRLVHEEGCRSEENCSERAGWYSPEVVDTMRELLKEAMFALAAVQDGGLAWPVDAGRKRTRDEAVGRRCARHRGAQGGIDSGRRAKAARGSKTAENEDRGSGEILRQVFVQNAEVEAKTGAAIGSGAGFRVGGEQQYERQREAEEDGARIEKQHDSGGAGGEEDEAVKTVPGTSALQGVVGFGIFGEGRAMGDRQRATGCVWYAEDEMADDEDIKEECTEGDKSEDGEPALHFS